LTSFTLRSAITAPGRKINEDAYGLWPNAQAPQAAWVLDGVTGINDRALLPGPTDAAWFVAQVQEALPALLATMAERPIVDVMTRLVDALALRQNAAWILPEGAAGFETPAASFVLFRHLGDRIEIARLGDCLVLLEKADGSIQLLDDPILSAIEAGIKTRITAIRSQGSTDEAAILGQMMPFLRDVRRRRNIAGGYGVLAADRACLDLLQIDRFPVEELRNILLVSDGYYRLVDVYGAMSNADLLRRTAESSAEAMLAELRAIEAADPKGARHPRLKMADDATAVLLRRTGG
jgi:serine/threonine protein phosphatase PrpC